MAGLLVDLLSYSAAVSGLFSLLALALIARSIQLLRQRAADRTRSDQDSES